MSTELSKTKTTNKTQYEMEKAPLFWKKIQLKYVVRMANSLEQMKLICIYNIPRHYRLTTMQIN